MDKTIQILKALSDPTRLRLIRILTIDQEFCVCALMDALEMPQYHISKHLGVLRHAGLVQHRRCGTWAYYSLASDLSTDVKNLVVAASNLIASDPIAHDDIERLKRHQPREEEIDCCEAS